MGFDRKRGFFVLEDVEKLFKRKEIKEANVKIEEIAELFN